MSKAEKLLILTAVCLVALLGLGCESRTDKGGSGGVLLSVSDFDGLPVAISVNAAAGGLVQIEQVTLENITADPDAISGDLMNIEIRSYEVTYTRADAGTRIPPPFVRNLFGVVPAGGTIDFLNLPVMGSEQLLNAPLEDLLFVNGGFDQETGDAVIILNIHMRFFGRTLSGDPVISAPASFTVEFTQ
jgi:hypothetical protein